MSVHFFLHRKYWGRGGSMCIMYQGGREVRSCMDYLLGAYFRLFRNVSVRESRHNTDQYMILGSLCSAALREYTQYLGRRKYSPLRPTRNSTR